MQSDSSGVHHAAIPPGIADIPIGRSISNYKIYILDSHQRLVPVGISGEICISGAGVARGYLNNPELTVEKFDQDLWDFQDYQDLKKSEKKYKQTLKQKFFGGSRGAILQKSPPGLLYTTGDLGQWLPDGNIRFLGRKDQQIKIRGYRVETGEIESRLIKTAGIKEAVVTMREDKGGDKYLCAYIVYNEDNEGVELSSLRESLALELPHYMIPSFFVPLNRLPLTPTGKVDRKALPEPEIETGTAYAAPQNQVQKGLQRIWQEVLGIEPIGINDNFFHMGGHSLKGIQVINTIHQEFNVKIPLAEMFRTPTIKGLSEYIEKSAEDKFVSLEPVEEKEFYELSYNQKRLWIIHHLNPQTTSYHMSTMITLDHDVNEETVRKVLQMIIDRHESLRTRFETVNNKPVQFIKKYVEAPFEVINISALDREEKEKKAAQVYAEIINTPFDLSKAPLFRSVLLKSDEETFYFVFTLHHIITDGWSLEILRKEVFTLYEALGKGEQVEPEPLKLQYKDFSAWHNKHVENPGVKEKSHKFWARKLQNGIPVFHLPADYSIHRNKRDGAAYRCPVSEDIKTGLKKIAQDNNTTLSMVMLSAYIILLSQLTGRQEITCALISAGKNHVSLSGIVGYFTNLVMIISRVDPGETFEDFLERVDADILQTFEYQDYPIELVLDDLKINYPDTPAAFNMLNLLEDTTAGKIENFDSYHIRDHYQEAEFDIELYAAEYKNGIEFNWRYRKALFKPSTIELISRAYLQLLDYITHQ
jgi:acyl carrier protein